MSWFFSNKKKEYSIFGYNNSIEFQLDKQSNFLYGVLAEYKGSIANHCIHFLCELNYINNYTVEVNQKQVYINDQLPDLMMETLADDIRKKMYPIAFNLGSNGQLVSIANYKKYQENWNYSKEQLEKRYKGYVVTNILEQIQVLVEDHRTYLDKFKENLFLQFMFLPIYDLVFNTDCKRSLEMSFKLYKNLPDLIYRVDFVVANKPTSTNKVFVIITGELLEQEYYEYYRIESSEFKFYLKLNIEDKVLFSIEGEINSVVEDKKEQIKLSSYLQD